MEAREEVEQEQDQEQLVKLHTENKQRQATLCKQLAGAFARGDIDGARQLVAQLSYWVRLEEAICDKL
jgi:DnaJ-domain-containing protein 1